MSTGPLSGLLEQSDFFRRFALTASGVASAADTGDVAVVLEDLATLCGADSASFASVINDDERYESYRFILAGDPTWCLRYEARAGYLDDPWLEYSRRHGEPAVARQAMTRQAGPAVLPLVEGRNTASALIVPALSPRGLTRYGCLVLGSRNPEHFSDALVPVLGLLARGLAQEILAWQVAQVRLDLQGRARLSLQDLKLLAIEQHAKTSKEIARITDSTSISVDSRWQRLKAKLRVSSRSAAARLAAECELIPHPMPTGQTGAGTRTVS